jgi:protein gp37
VGAARPNLLRRRLARNPAGQISAGALRGRLPRSAPRARANEGGGALAGPPRAGETGQTLVERSPQDDLRDFWLLLTKQIRRLAKLSARIGGLPDNCMAMTTVTSERTAEARIPALLDVECRWRGISVEPLLEPIDLTERGRGLRCESCLDRSVRWCGDPVCDWVIVGGESRANARPTSVAWIRDLMEQCADAHVPCFVKQLGAEWARQANASNKKGGDPAEWPSDLRVRQVPRNLIHG